MIMPVHQLSTDRPSVFGGDIPIPDMFGLIVVADDTTNVAESVTIGAFLSGSPISHTIECAVQNYDTLLRRLAD